MSSYCVCFMYFQNIQKLKCNIFEFIRLPKIVIHCYRYSNVLLLYKSITTLIFQTILKVQRFMYYVFLLQKNNYTK